MNSMLGWRVLRRGVAAAIGVPRVLLCCLLAVGFAVCGTVAAPAADLFQRTILIRNDLPITIYPVISAVENQNYNCGSTGVLRRIIVNAKKKGLGIPTGQTVLVNIPKTPSCWYQAVRLYLFSVDLAAFEKRINPKQQTTPDGATYNPPLCPDSACWTGTAPDQYPIDSPAQLTEYTVDSLDPATGDPFPDPNNPNGIPLVDLDLSFVDSVYLPVAMALDDGGLTQYMGSGLSYTTFNQRSAAFLGLVDATKRPIWSEFAAYSALNWPNNVFNDLGSKRTDQVEGGYNLVHLVRVNSQTALYLPTYKGPPACSNPANKICMEKGLVGMCCPAQSASGPVFLNCCSVQPYLINNTTKTDATVTNPNGQASNPSANSFVQRWTTWINTNPCADISKITSWPSNLPAFNKQAFCDTFRSTVQYLWATFFNVAECTKLSGTLRTQCVVDNIVGYKSAVKAGKLPESVQAVMRSVPWGDQAKGQLEYSFDKFILTWAPYQSPFNMNPYTRLVHNTTDGLAAPGAYAFSIDDRYGNFQSRASGFIVDAGAITAMPNKMAYDPYYTYDVGFAGGWDHGTVCGRPLPIPGKKPGNGPISFWSNGTRQTSCDVVLFTDAAGTQFAKYRVNEVSKTVTDTYTGLAQKVFELSLDKTYCTANSSPALVAKAVCINSNVSSNVNGDLNYVSLSTADKPDVHLNLPANPL